MESCLFVEVTQCIFRLHYKKIAAFCPMQKSSSSSSSTISPLFVHETDKELRPFSWPSPGGPFGLRLRRLGLLLIARHGFGRTCQGSLRGCVERGFLSHGATPKIICYKGLSSKSTIYWGCPMTMDPPNIIYIYIYIYIYIIYIYIYIIYIYHIYICEIFTYT